MISHERAGLDNSRKNLGVSRNARFCVAITQKAHTEEGSRFLVTRVFSGAKFVTPEIEAEAKILISSGKSIMIRNLARAESYQTIERKTKIHGQTDGFDC